jgi:6-phosphofructo-2-kinase / fructose-2,6-biphosphatase 4
MLDFFDRAGQVAIYDANNGTKESRTELYAKYHGLGYHVIFLGQSGMSPAAVA